MLQSKVPIPPDVRNQIRQQLAGEIELQRRLLSCADPQLILAALAEALVILSKGAYEHEKGSKSNGFQIQLAAAIAFFRQIGTAEQVLEPLIHGGSEFLGWDMGQMPGGLFQDRSHRSPASDREIMKVCLLAALEILLLMDIRPISTALDRLAKDCPKPMRALPFKQRKKGKLSAPTARLEGLRDKIGSRLDYFREGTKEAVFLATVRARLSALDALTDANRHSVLEREYKQMVADAERHLRRIS